MVIDTHMHTPFCGHAVGKPTDYVKAAAARGIGLIAFTCHIPLLPDHMFGGRRIRMRERDLSKYRKSVEKARDLGCELGIEVLLGIESEVFPDPEIISRMAALIEAEEFDFVLGSLHHQLDGYQDWLDQQGLVDDGKIVRCYFRHLIEGVRSGIYDSIAHPDVIRIYGTVSPFPPEAYQQEIEEFLDVLVEEDHCMEVNTSGLIKGVYEVHPAPAVLDWAVERGVKLTMGSDAHSPEQVGQHFPAVREMLKRKGFTKLHYFRKRERFEVSL